MAKIIDQDFVVLPGEVLSPTFEYRYQQVANYAVLFTSSSS